MQELPVSSDCCQHPWPTACGTVSDTNGLRRPRRHAPPTTSISLHPELLAPLCWSPLVTVGQGRSGGMRSIQNVANLCNVGSSKLGPLATPVRLNTYEVMEWVSRQPGFLSFLLLFHPPPGMRLYSCQTLLYSSRLLRSGLAKSAVETSKIASPAQA